MDMTIVLVFCLFWLLFLCFVGIFLFFFQEKERKAGWVEKWGASGRDWGEEGA